MTLEERKRYAEILLICSLRGDLGKTFNEKEVKRVIDRQIIAVSYDDFYREFYGYLVDPWDSRNLLPIFFAVKNMEVLDMIHRRLYEYNSNQFYRIVVPVLFEFASKVTMERSSKSLAKSRSNSIDRRISDALSVGSNPYISIKSNLFRAETEGDTFDNRIKGNFPLTIRFYTILLGNIYTQLGGRIEIFERIKDEIKATIEDLGVTVYREISGESIDTFFFLIYFKNETRLICRLLFLENRIVESGVHGRILFKDGFLFFLRTMGMEIPVVPEVDPLVPNIVGHRSIELDDTVRIVDRKEFLYRLWGWDPD
jgi:hypothetical protein